MSIEEGYKVTRLDGTGPGDVEPPEYIEFDDEELPDWIRPTKEQEKAWEREQRQAALADIYREPEPEAISGMSIGARNAPPRYVPSPKVEEPNLQENCRLAPKRKGKQKGVVRRARKKKQKSNPVLLDPPVGPHVPDRAPGGPPVGPRFYEPRLKQLNPRRKSKKSKSQSKVKITRCLAHTDKKIVSRGKGKSFKFVKAGEGLRCKNSALSNGYCCHHGGARSSLTDPGRRTRVVKVRLKPDERALARAFKRLGIAGIQEIFRVGLRYFVEDRGGIEMAWKQVLEGDWE